MHIARYRRARNEEARATNPRTSYASPRACMGAGARKGEREITIERACSDKDGSEISKILLHVGQSRISRLARSLARSLVGREDERAYWRLGPVTYHYIDETLAGLVLFYTVSLLHMPFDIMSTLQFSKFISDYTNDERKEGNCYKL